MSFFGLATKNDLDAMETRLLKAIRERVDPESVHQLTNASNALEKAVEANQPKLSRPMTGGTKTKA